MEEALDKDTQQRWNDFLSGSVAEMNKKNETNLVCSWGGEGRRGEGMKERRKEEGSEGEGEVGGKDLSLEVITHTCTLKYICITSACL